MIHEGPQQCIDAWRPGDPGGLERLTLSPKMVDYMSALVMHCSGWFETKKCVEPFSTHGFLEVWKEMPILTPAMCFIKVQSYIKKTCVSVQYLFNYIIHPSIIFHLSGVSLWLQQAKQSVPDVPLPSNTYSLLLADLQAHFIL